MAPHLSIRIVILILLSDTGGTLFGDHLFWISSDHPNRETAMLQCRAESDESDGKKYRYQVGCIFLV